MAPTEAKLPLSGIKIIDFSQAMSGPTGAMILGDFGAEVIKVEPPGGDNSRRWGSMRYGENKEFSSQYLALNRNKNSIVIDLKNPEGIAITRRLIDAADVVLENFKPGVMARLGLGYEEVSRTNPRIIYCSVSGFGQTGPLSSRPGYDQLMQAYAGLLSVTGDPEGGAVRIGPSAIDILTGAHAVIGILMALRERESSGRGQLVDTSLYEAAIHMMAHIIVDYTGSRIVPGRQGRFFPYLAPYGLFHGSDREFYLGAANQGMWTRLCDAIGRPDLTGDARFRGNGDRAKNQTVLYEILEPIFRTRTAREWVDLADELAIPASLVADMSEVVVQEQALARQAVVPIEGYEGVRSAGIPIKLSRTPGTIRKPPPSMGADGDEILRRLGVDETEIKALRVCGAIGSLSKE